MAATAASGSHMATVKPCMSSSQRTYMSCTSKFGTNSEVGVWRRFKSSSHISATQPISQSLKSGPLKSIKVVTRAMSGAAENSPLPGLPIDLRGNRAFIAGVADDYGYGWAISKALAAEARVAFPSDAASLLKAAQVKNVVHIMPTVGSSTQSVKAGGMPTHSELPPNVHILHSSSIAMTPL